MVVPNSEEEELKVLEEVMEEVKEEGEEEQEEEEEGASACTVADGGMGVIRPSSSGAGWAHCWHDRRWCERRTRFEKS